jgi:integrase/recombinase XerD
VPTKWYRLRPLPNPYLFPQPQHSAEQSFPLDELVAIEPLHVAAYIEALQRDFEQPSVKQHLAALRMLFDWLVTGGIVTTNPAHAVRGPKHVVKSGKTPVLTGEQARALLDSIDTSTVVGLRDRALISIMTFAFARIGAVVAIRVEDYYPRGKCWWVRRHEKGGKRHEMPAHHTLEAYLDDYLDAAGIRDSGKSPLFRSAAGRTGTLEFRGQLPHVEFIGHLCTACWKQRETIRRLRTQPT